MDVGRRSGAEAGDAGAFAAWARTRAPFDLLDGEAFARLAAAARLERRARGEALLPAGTPGRIAVLRSGRARICVRPGGAAEFTLEERGPGDALGLFPPAGDWVRFCATAVEDAEVFFLEGEPVLAAARRCPAFADHFLAGLVAGVLDHGLGRRPRTGAVPAGGERRLWSTSVGELCSPRAVTAPAGLPIREAAARMRRHRIGSLVITGEGGAPAGIVTDSDLRSKVVAAGVATDRPVGEVMTPAPVAVDARASGFEALHLMAEIGVHHLAVTERGRLRGVVTNHDLMILQGASPLSLVRDIESAATAAEAAAAAAGTHGLLAALLEQEVRASAITRVVTEVNDRLVLRVLALAAEAAGAAPLPWCWIAFGSEGRREQTFRTDQDNALVLADAATAAEAADAAAWAERFAVAANGALVEAGFPPCPGGYMARNPVWRQPLRVWREYFTGWIATPTPEAILASVILFDFRPLAGELSLGAELREPVTRAAPRHAIFLKHLADLAVGVRPPLGLFGRLRTERSGDRRGTINLKHRCLAPLINIVRLFAMEAGVARPGTLERVDGLRAAGAPTAAHADALVQVFEFLSLLRIRNQHRLIEAGEAPHNHVDPRRLTLPERRELGESCRFILELQEGIARRYSPGSRL